MSGTSEVFSLQASCLNDLGFYFDAISAYDEAIPRNPKQGIVSNYHMRSLVKDSIFDYKGSLTDIEEAIQLSELDNDDNRFWNEYARKTGFNTATQFYEWQGTW
jgi:tetratricopeptide (TPR) repeat protein